MPRDGQPAPPPHPWLDPVLIRALSARVESARRAGLPQAELERRCREQARALRPAWPVPWVEEAASIAVWVGTPGER